MAESVKFQFARPFTPRVVEVVYVSPPVCQIAYPSGSGDGVSEL